MFKKAFFPLLAAISLMVLGCNDEKAPPASPNNNNGPSSTSNSAAPVASDYKLTVYQNTATPIGLQASDADANVLSYRISVAPSHGTLSQDANGGWIFTPEAGYHGSDNFTYIANDGTYDSKEATVTLSIDRQGALAISAASFTNFGFVVKDATSSIDTITILNQGDVPVTGLSASSSDSHFHFVGDVYPGTGGNCADRLDPAATCTVKVVMIPNDAISYATDIKFSFLDGKNPDAQMFKEHLVGAGTIPGLLDATFGYSSGKTVGVRRDVDIYERISIVKVQTDSKIYLAGSVASGLTRLLSNGKLDTGYGSNGIAETPTLVKSGDALSMLVNSDNSVLRMGVYVDSGTDKFYLVKNLANGQLDTAFGIGGKVDLSQVAPSSGSKNSALNMGHRDMWIKDGKISLLLKDSTTSSAVMVRLDAVSGSMDSSFGTAGYKSLSDLGTACKALDSYDQNGKLVVMGRESNADGNDTVIVRYNADMTLDSTFGTAGKTTILKAASGEYPSAIRYRSGRFVVVIPKAIIHLLPNGKLDNDAATGFGDSHSGTKVLAALDPNMTTVEIQSDGKILYGGTKVLASGTSSSGQPITTNSSFSLTRLNADGSRDNAFGTSGFAETRFDNGTSLQLAYVRSLAIQGGKIIAAGMATQMRVGSSNNYQAAIVRYLP